MTEKEPKEKGKEPQVRNVVMKVNIDCVGCANKLHRSLQKINGLQEFAIDAPRGKVTVKGTMEAEKMMKKLRRRTGRRFELLKEEKIQTKEASKEAAKATQEEDNVKVETKELQREYVYPNNSGFFSEEETCNMM